MDKLVEKFPDTYKVMKRDELSATYTFPKKLISKPRVKRKSKPITEEHKLKLQQAQQDYRMRKFSKL